MRIIDLFVQILNMSISASVVVMLLTLIRVVFRQQMTAGFKYLMWVLVSIRLWLPVSLPVEFSLFNLFSHGQRHSDSYLVSIEYIPITETYVSMNQNHLNWYLIGTTIWLFGCLLIVLYQLFLLISTKRLCRSTIEITDCPTLEQCKQECGVKQPVSLELSDKFNTPVAVGLFHVKILLPMYIDLDDTAALRHILLHELVHIRRRDRWIKFFLVLTTTIHWFNPILWICSHEVENDIETSCDERVLSMLSKDEQLQYARTLLDACENQKRHFDLATMSFMKRSDMVQFRVMGVLQYKPLNRLRKTLLALLMILLALLTTTNPVAAYDGYIPSDAVISDNLYEVYEGNVRELSQNLSNGNVESVLSMSKYDDPYYFNVYSVLKETPLKVTSYRLYPQSDDLVYAYLLCEDGGHYVAQLNRKGEKIKVTSLQEESIFAATKTVKDGEAVRFVRNLHRFGIVGKESNIPDWSIAALCISEEYYDRVKSGEISEDTVYLPEEWVQSAAKTYFGRENFSYTLDEEMYDEDLGCYIYLTDREDPANAEVISCEKQGDGYRITANLYRDPLKLLPQATITYQLASKVSQ